MIWSKTWHRKETFLEVGLSLNDWALPLHLEACRPYTTSTKPERWKNDIIITVLCFYVRIEWRNMTTKEQVIELRVNDSRATLRQIGNKCHITRERVRQILKEQGLPTAAQVDRIPKFCKTCGKKLKQANKTGYCQKHLKDGITHCPQGHPYNEGNTHISSRGDRVCRACAREKKRRWYAAHHAEQLAYRRLRRLNQQAPNCTVQEYYERRVVMSNSMAEYPKAICQSCNKKFSGWSLAQRESCDCGGKLIIDFPYNQIIGYIKAGNRNEQKEET